MLWIGSRLSPLERLSVASFLANGHPVHLYAYAPIEGVPAGTRLVDAREVLPESAVFTYAEGFGKGSPSAFANQFRYQLLFDRGGVWCDADVACLVPLDFLAAMPYAISSQRTQPRPGGPPNPVQLNPCLLKAPRGCALLRDCLAECAAAQRSALRWGMTGPKLLSRMVVAHGLQDYALLPEVTCPVDFWQVQDLVEQPFDPQPDWHAIHFWNEMWRARGLAKDARYPPDCAYEALKRRYGI